jgi:hypothetical protein
LFSRDNLDDLTRLGAVNYGGFFRTKPVKPKPFKKASKKAAEGGSCGAGSFDF